MKRGNEKKIYEIENRKKEEKEKICSEKTRKTRKSQ